VGDREPAMRIAAIAAGGALGTLARYEVARALVATPSGISWPTFLVNISGSFLLGVIITLVTERWPPTRSVRPFAAIGFCGGFTTFSTLMVESARRFQTGHAGWAVGYLALSLLAGVVAAGLGVAAARYRTGAGAMATGDRGPIPDPDAMGDLADRPGPATPVEPAEPAEPTDQRTAP